MGELSQAERQGKASPSMNLPEIMNCVFYPKSVAVIGASRDSEKEKKFGWVGRLLQFGYEGKIYPINPQATNLVGLPAYPSVTSVPDPIDYAIVAVPRRITPKAVEECVSKGVKAVHVFTAGFAEVGDQEGKELQTEIERIVRPSKTSLLGPNCMGVYCPAGGLTFDESFSKESGSIGFVSQTGVGARRLIRLALGRGLRFSKVVSYGNAADLSGTDFLEYVVSDPETETILLYVEGLTDGHRFFELLRECTPKKPVVLLKAGLSESGAGAVASHTASLAGSRETWQALFKQTRAIPVESLEEAVEQLVAVVNIPHIKRRNMGLVGRGGGIGCVTTDMCEREGLKVPAFTPETRSKLVEATSDYAGSSVRNPVETGIGRTGLSKRYSEAIQIVAADPQIDIVMTFLNPEAYFEYDIGDWVNEVSTQLIETAKTISKPLVMMLLPGQNVEVFEGNMEIQRRLQKAGIACFSSLDSGIRAVSKLIAYYEFKDK